MLAFFSLITTCFAFGNSVNFVGEIETTTAEPSAAISWSISDDFGNQIKTYGTISRSIGILNPKNKWDSRYPETQNFENIKTTLESNTGEMMATLKNTLSVEYPGSSIIRDVGIIDQICGKLDGVIVCGSVQRGIIDYGLNIENLIIAGVKSKCTLDYNSLNGVTSVSQDCKFGDFPLQPKRNKTSIFNSNLDNIRLPGIPDDTTDDIHLHFVLGQLIVTGKIQRLDRKDSERNELNWELRANVQRSDAAKLNFNDPKNSLNARALLVFLKLMIFNLVDEPNPDVQIR